MPPSSSTKSLWVNEHLSFAEGINKLHDATVIDFQQRRWYTDIVTWLFECSLLEIRVYSPFIRTILLYLSCCSNSWIAWKWSYIRQLSPWIVDGDRYSFLSYCFKILGLLQYLHFTIGAISLTYPWKASHLYNPCEKLTRNTFFV